MIGCSKVLSYPQITSRWSAPHPQTVSLESFPLYFTFNYIESFFEFLILIFFLSIPPPYPHQTQVCDLVYFFYLKMAAEGSGALTSQGAIDWVALSKMTVSFSVELLARYSRAGVEPLTVAVGQALFTHLADAQKRLGLSVSKLRAYSSAANALWFGIGFKHLIRTLMETEQGATLNAVSSCLMVSYDSQFSATVLKTLCDQCSMPDSLTPSLSQWCAFVKLCAPAVTASQFPILVEGFSRLLMTDANKKEPSKIAATAPSQLAAALLELAQLSKRKVASVTLMGNADCGWLAALAEWLFSLQIEIIDHAGNVLYQSKENSYADMGSFHLTILRLGDGQSTAHQSLLRSRAYLVTPGDCCFSVISEPSSHLFYQGLSEWSTILNDAFGSTFQRLLQPEIIPLFVQVLYSGLRVERQDFRVDGVSPWENNIFIKDDGQHQHFFIQLLRFAASRLPELTPVEKYVKDHAPELDRLELDRHKLSLGKTAQREPSKIQYELAFGYSTSLIDACTCNDCNDPPHNTYPLLDRAMQCLSKTAIAVYDFISYLSWLDIDDTIRPSSNGLRSLYCFDNHSIGIIEDKCSNGKSFEQVIRVLTGLRTTENENLSAVARHGLCIYRPYF